MEFCIILRLFFNRAIYSRCADCDMACHKKCEKLTGNLCGLNQKLVAEALQALKRGEFIGTDKKIQIGDISIVRHCFLIVSKFRKLCFF